MLKKREVMILEDRAGEAFLLVRLVHLLLGQTLGSPAWLGPIASCMLLYIKRYIVFMKFFTVHQTMEKKNCI